MPNGIILSYDLIYAMPGGTNNTRTVAHDDSLAQYSVVQDSLQEFTLYNIRVSATTRIGEGTTSMDIQIRTDAGVPSRPTAAMATTINSTSIELSWGYPEIPRGNISGYRVTSNASINPLIQNLMLDIAGDTANQTTIVGSLLPFTYYNFQIAAFSSSLINPSEIFIGEAVEVSATTPQDGKLHRQTLYTLWLPTYNSYVYIMLFH